MKRFIASSRSRSNITNNSAVGDQLIREFTAQAQSIMQELSAQFADQLQAQADQILQSNIASAFADSADAVDGAAGAEGGDGDSTAGALGQLFNTAGRYLASRPRTSSSTGSSVSLGGVAASSARRRMARMRAMSSR